MEVIEKIKEHCIPFLLGLVLGLIIMFISSQSTKREMMVDIHDFTWRDCLTITSNYCNNIPTGVMNTMYALSRMNLNLMTREKYGIKTATMVETSGNSNIIQLLKDGYKISSLIGKRLEYTRWTGGDGSIFHDGYDLAMKRGTPIRAFSDGHVYQAAWSPSWGWQVIMEYPDGTYWRYAHMSAIIVRRKQLIFQGQTIGKCGNTGNSRGAHLHYGQVIL